jgi:hypothetical protein
MRYYLLGASEVGVIVLYRSATTMTVLPLVAMSGAFVYY